MTKPVNYPRHPRALWQRFYEITQVPRPSKRESKFIEYLIGVANAANLEYQIDSARNVVIYVPGSKGRENHKTVIIQGHMDMVCDKTEGRIFDFDNDPIDIFVKEGWIYADRTTLGADNGFGCAVALALIDEHHNIEHPPLELLFTTDEETGLNGALNLEPKFYTGKKLINIDSSEWGGIYIGCAGGVDYELRREFELRESSGHLVPVKLEIRGLSGGHSGVDIHKGRANALKILSEILWEIDAKCSSAELAELSGGTAHNVIPREAYAEMLVDGGDIQKIRDLCRNKEVQFKNYLPREDEGLTISLQELTEIPKMVLGEEDCEKVLSILNLFPHGATGFNWDSKTPLVTNSSNMAIFRLLDGKLFIETSLRYFDRNASKHYEQKLSNMAELFKMDISSSVGYDSWIPIAQSDLLDISIREYEKLLGKGQEVEVKAIHAGLECGILKSKLGKNTDAISIGPNIVSMHSPDEALEIESSQKFWELLLGILARL